MLTFLWSSATTADHHHSNKYMSNERCRLDLTGAQNRWGHDKHTQKHTTHTQTQIHPLGMSLRSRDDVSRKTVLDHVYGQARKDGVSHYCRTRHMDYYILLCRKHAVSIAFHSDYYKLRKLHHVPLLSRRTTHEIADRLLVRHYWVVSYHTICILLWPPLLSAESSASYYCTDLHRAY